MRIAKTARWTAEDGPLASIFADRDASSRFARMAAHVLSMVGADRDPEGRWVIGTCHGPRHDAALAALGGASPRPFTIPHAVGELAKRLGHRGHVSIVSAGARTVAMTLVEASARIGAGPVVVVIVEEGTPPRARAPLHDGLAVALTLVADDAPGPRMSAPRRRAEAGTSTARAVSPAVGKNATWPGLALVDAVRDEAWGWHPLEPVIRRLEPTWAVELRAPS